MTMQLLTPTIVIAWSGQTYPIPMQRESRASPQVALQICNEIAGRVPGAVDKCMNACRLYCTPSTFQYLFKRRIDLLRLEQTSIKIFDL